MTLIEQIKADREAGTPGPWGYAPVGSYTGVAHIVMAHQDRGAPFMVSESYDGTDEQDEINARRIARVPDMEAVLLAADELADAYHAVIELDNNTSPFGGELQSDRIERTLNRAEIALAAYRKATEAAQ